MLKYLRKMLYFYTDLFFSNIFRKKNSKHKDSKKSLAIIYYGLIGDYILFRNFLEEIRYSEKYKNYNITFIGNIIWKPLSEVLDKNFVDNFIWINHKELDRSRLYRWSLLLKLSKLFFDEVIVPFDSRTIRHDDLLAYAINSVIKKTIKSCNRNIEDSDYELKQKSISESWYNEIKEIDYKNLKFEFEINKAIFHALTEDYYKSDHPIINIPKNITISLKLPDKYIVFAVGGSRNDRQWPIEYFAKLAEFFLINTDYSIVLCGDKNDFARTKNIFDFIFVGQKNRNDFKERIINYCGKTSLLELLIVLKNSSILISGDTSLVHIAAALKDSGAKNHIFVIYPLESFSRFAPYPTNIYKKYYLWLHPKLDFTKIKTVLFSPIKRLSIKDMKPEQLIEFIKSKINI